MTIRADLQHAGAWVEQVPDPGAAAQRAIGPEQTVVVQHGRGDSGSARALFAVFAATDCRTHRPWTGILGVDGPGPLPAVRMGAGLH